MAFVVLACILPILCWWFYFLGESNAYRDVLKMYHEKAKKADRHSY